MNAGAIQAIQRIILDEVADIQAENLRKIRQIAREWCLWNFKEMDEREFIKRVALLLNKEIKELRHTEFKNHKKHIPQTEVDPLEALLV